jgi:hypothetical protein
MKAGTCAERLSTFVKPGMANPIGYTTPDGLKSAVLD